MSSLLSVETDSSEDEVSVGWRVVWCLRREDVVDIEGAMDAEDSERRDSSNEVPLSRLSVIVDSEGVRMSLRVEGGKCFEGVITGGGGS